MKTPLTTTAVIEFGAGLGLLCCPSPFAAFLLGAPVEVPTAITVARVGGAGLLALSVACWLARGDANSRAARGLVAGMLLYNFATVVILTYARIGLGLYGVALWPAVALHVVMTIWCLTYLRHRPLQVMIDSNLRNQ